jgi:hypothetical protein
LSRNSPPFTEAESSLKSLRRQATSPCSEPDKSNQHAQNKLHLSLSSNLSLQAFQPKFCKNFLTPHARYMPRPPQAPWCDHSNNIWRKVQTMELPIWCSFLQHLVTSSLLDPNIL